MLYSSAAWSYGFGFISVSDGLKQAERFTSSTFLQECFSVWALLRKGMQQQAESLYWLLEGPSLFGSLLDCPVWGRTTLSRRLHAAQVFSLKRVVELAG